MDRERVTRFVERWLEDPNTASLSVMHVGDRGASVLDSIDVPTKDRPDVEEIIERFEESVSGHATSTAQAQRYAVAAVSSTTGKTSGQLFFRIAPEPTADVAIVDSEPPTGRGIVKQCMRHAEAMMRMQLAAMSNTLGHLSTQNASLVQRVDTLESTHFKRIELIEDLLSQRHLRELETARQRADAERTDRLLTQAESMVPVVMSRVTGATDTVKLLKTFTPEQLQLFAGTLQPEQRELFDKILGMAKGEDDAMQNFMGGAAPTQAAAAE